MVDKLKVCVHCRHDFKHAVSDDIGFHAHWVDDFYYVDVVLFIEVACRLYEVFLFREAWLFEGHRPSGGSGATATS